MLIHIQSLKILFIVLTAFSFLCLSLSPLYGPQNPSLDLGACFYIALAPTVMIGGLFPLLLS